jgi:hypothetical protein
LAGRARRRQQIGPVEPAGHDERVGLGEGGAVDELRGARADEALSR